MFIVENFLKINISLINFTTNRGYVVVYHEMPKHKLFNQIVFVCFVLSPLWLKQGVMESGAH